MSTRVYVENLAHVVSEHDLVEVFSCVGHVVDAKINHHRMLGEPGMSGWVTMSDARTAARAVQRFDGRRLFGLPLTVKPSRKIVQRSEPRLH